MENQAAATLPPVSQAKRPNLVQRAMENPVIRKELRGRMRGRQAFVLLTAYLILVGLVIGVVYAGLASSSSYGSGSIEIRQAAGKAIFGTVVLLELFLISFIGPALTSGAITSEREHQTFDLLRTTTLPARSFVLGKLGSALAYLLLLVFAALPVESIAFLLGGVGLEEIVVSTLMMVVTAVFFCSLGMLFSSLMKRTLAATVGSYASIILSYVLLGLLFFAVTMFTSLLYSGSNRDAWEAVMTILLWTVVCTNPMIAAGVSESILISDQNLFFTHSAPFGGSGTTYLPSPWIPFTIVYVAAAVLMIALSIHRVRRRER